MNKSKILSVSFVLFFVTINFVSCFKNDKREAIPPPNPCAGTPGPLFTAVKNLISAKCRFCHNSVTTNGGKDYTIDCNIVTGAARIKIRAVDQGSMPPSGTLPASDKLIISNWIIAGAKYTD